MGRTYVCVLRTNTARRGSLCMITLPCGGSCEREGSGKEITTVTSMQRKTILIPLAKIASPQSLSSQLNVICGGHVYCAACSVALNSFIICRLADVPSRVAPASISSFAKA